MCPMKPKKPCKQPGCNELTYEKYCDKHKELYRNERPSAANRGYDYKWRKERSRFLKEHPLCAYCMKEGEFTKATVVDHIIPHRGDEKLFWDEMNWQPLCKSCHDRKTMTKDRYKEYKY